MRENREEFNNEEQIRVNQVRNRDNSLFQLNQFVQKQNQLFDDVSNIRETVNNIKDVMGNLNNSLSAIQRDLSSLTQRGNFPFVDLNRTIQEQTNSFKSLTREGIIETIENMNEEAREVVENVNVDEQVSDLNERIERLTREYENVVKPKIIDFVENFIKGIIGYSVTLFNDRRVKERIQEQINQLKEERDRILQEIKEPINVEPNLRQERIEVQEQLRPQEEINPVETQPTTENQNIEGYFKQQIDYLKVIQTNIQNMGKIYKKEWDLKLEEQMDIRSRGKGEREIETERDIQKRNQLNTFLGSLFGGITGTRLGRVGGSISPRFLTGGGFQQMTQLDFLRQMGEWRDEEGNIDILGAVMGTLQGGREGGQINQLFQGGKWQALGFTIGGPIGQLISGGQGQVLGQIGQERLRTFQDNVWQFFTGIRVTEEELQARIDEIQNDPKYRDLEPEQLREIQRRQLQMEKHPVIYKLQNAQKQVGRIMAGPFIGLKNILFEGVLYTEEEVERRFLELKQEYPELSDEELRRMQEEQLRRERTGSSIIQGIVQLGKWTVDFLKISIPKIGSFIKNVQNQVKDFFFKVEEVSEEEIQQKIEELRNDPQYQGMSDEELRVMQEQILNEDKTTPFIRMVRTTFSKVKNFFSNIFSNVRGFIKNVIGLGDEQINEKIEELRADPQYAELSEEELRQKQEQLLKEEKKQQLLGMVRGVFEKGKQFVSNIFGKVRDFFIGIVPITESQIDQKIEELKTDPQYQDMSEERLRELQQEEIFRERKERLTEMSKSVINGIKKQVSFVFGQIKGLFTQTKTFSDEYLKNRIEELRKENPDLTDEELREMQMQEIEQRQFDLRTIGITQVSFLKRGVSFLIKGIRGFFDNTKQVTEEELNQRIEELRAENPDLTEEELRLKQLDEIKQEWQKNHPILNITKKQFNWFSNTIKNIFGWFKGEKDRLETEISKEYNRLFSEIRERNREIQEEELTSFWKTQIGGEWLNQKNLNLRPIMEQIQNMEEEQVKELFGLTKEQIEQLYEISGIDKKIDVDELQQLIKEGTIGIEEQYDFVYKLSSMGERLEDLGPEKLRELFGTTDLGQIKRKVREIVPEDIQRQYEQNKEKIVRTYEDVAERLERNKEILEEQMDKLINLDFEDLKSLDKEILSALYNNFQELKQKWQDEDIPLEKIDRLQYNILKLKQMGVFQEGGFTGFGRGNEIVGFVHQNEYVIPQNILQLYPEMVSSIEQLRRGLVSQEEFEREMVQIWDAKNLDFENAFRDYDFNVWNEIQRVQMNTEQLVTSQNSTLQGIYNVLNTMHNENEQQNRMFENIYQVLQQMLEELRTMKIENNLMNSNNIQMKVDQIIPPASVGKQKIEFRRNEIPINKVGGRR